METTLSHEQLVTMRSKIAQHFISVVINRCRTYGYFQYDMIAFGTGTVTTRSRTTIFGLKATGVAIIHQSIGILVGFKVHRTAITAVAAVRAALRDEFLTTETDAAIAAFASFYSDTDFINELHGNNALVWDVQIKTPQLLCSQGASAYSGAIKPLERCLRSYGCSYL